MSKENSIRLPCVINGYIFKDVIGSGGYGKIYLAESIRYKISFAVKCISTTPTNELESEIESLLKLDHPNIIRIYDHFVYDDKSFLVLELCQKTLGDMIVPEVGVETDVMMQICSHLVESLYYTHNNLIAHCDIKPSNILFNAHGQMKLADFGLSIDVGKIGESHKFIGSLAYSPPEIFLKKQNYDPFLADVWSLGVLFYEMLTGELPFPSKDINELKRSVLVGYFASSYRAKHPLWCLIKRMILVDPEKRISIEELANHPLLKIRHIALKSCISTPLKELKTSNSPNALQRSSKAAMSTKLLRLPIFNISSFASCKKSQVYKLGTFS